MNSVLSFTEPSAVLSYGPALAIAIIPITIDNRHISRCQEGVSEGFSSDLVLARSPPSRSEDKASLMAGPDGVSKICPLCVSPSSFSLLYYLLLLDSIATRPGSPQDSSTSHDNDLGAVPIKVLPSRPPLFEDCSPRRRKRRRRSSSSGSSSSNSRGRTKSHRFDSPWRVFMRCVIGESRRGQGRLYLGAKLEGHRGTRGYRSRTSDTDLTRRDLAIA